MRRLVEAYRSATVPPAGVEKASRWERAKRNFVMVATTVIAAVLSLAVVSVPVRIAGWEPHGPVEAFALAAVWIVVWWYIDIRIFRYAVVRFELVPPWQFRVDALGGPR